MSQHHECRSIQGRGIKAEDAENYEAQVADRGVRDQLLHIGLHHRDERTINNANQRQNRNPPGIALRLLREQAQVEAQQAIGAHLQEHPSQQHRACGRSFNVGVR